MPSEIHLVKYTPDLKMEIPISDKAWEDVLRQTAGLKFDTNKAFLMVYSEDEKEWLPLFWISKDGAGYRRQSGFFDDEILWIKAQELAMKLEAILFGDDGQMLFHSKFGSFIDDDFHGDIIEMSIDELSEFIEKEGFNVDKLMAQKNNVGDNYHPFQTVKRIEHLHEKRFKFWLRMIVGLLCFISFLCLMLSF